MVPADRFLNIKLEEGLDWEQICPFLGVSIPEEEWPKRNTTADFHVFVRSIWWPSVVKGMLTSLVSGAAIGGLAWLMKFYLS